MKKLFISQPMRDKTDEEIKEERAKIVKAVTEHFTQGWKDYRGCKIEHECAVQYGIDIVGE